MPRRPIAQAFLVIPLGLRLGLKPRDLQKTAKIAEYEAMFIHEFVRDWIIDNMEDPVKRTKRSNEYLLSLKQRAENL